MSEKNTQRESIEAGSEDARIHEEALAWLERLRTAGTVEREAFLSWLRVSPKHVREILLATAWDKVLADLQRDQPRAAEPATVPAAKTSNTTPPSQPLRRTVWPWWLGVGLASSLFIALPSTDPFQLYGVRHVTRIGEQQRVMLPDGSRAQLNTNTKLIERYDDRERAVHLERGQATFDVMHQPRTFVVYLNELIVRAIGTRFDIRRDDSEIRIAVLEGTVEWQRNAQDPPHRLSGGGAVTLAASSTTHTRIQPKDVVAWQQRRLIFRNQRLTEIAAEFNRYNELKLEIAADIANRRYSGMFDATNPQSFIASLERDATLVITRDSNRVRIDAAGVP